MDFIDAQKRKAHRIRLGIGYVLVAIAIFLASYIIYLRSISYDFDFGSGEVIQKGLVFINSQPDGADIYLDDGLYSSRTSARLHIPSGIYNLVLKKQGYRNWEKSFELEGGSVERFSYPVLFPENITTTTIGNLSASPSIFSSSPDRRWLLVDMPGFPFNFQVFDIDDTLVTSRTIVLPNPIISNPSQVGTIKVVEWSNDNRHVLLQRVYEGGQEYYVLDREQPELSINLSRTLRTTAESIRLLDKRADRFYLFTTSNGTLQTADIRSGAISEPILTQVKSYKTYGENLVLYARNIQENGLTINEVGVLENGTSHILHRYENQALVSIDVSRFNNRWYFAVGNAEDNRVLIYIDPIEKMKSNPTDKTAKPDTFLAMPSLQQITFSTNSRFIAAQSGQRVAVYDAELREKHAFDLEDGSYTGDKPWMDGHRLAYVVGSQVMVVEFDGKNKQTLTPGMQGMAPAFDTAYKNMYNFIPAQNGAVSLQRAALTTNKQ